MNIKYQISHNLKGITLLLAQIKRLRTHAKMQACTCKPFTPLEISDCLRLLLYFLTLFWIVRYYNTRNLRETRVTVNRKLRNKLLFLSKQNIIQLFCIFTILVASLRSSSFRRGTGNPFWRTLTPTLVITIYIFWIVMYPYTGVVHPCPPPKSPCVNLWLACCYLSTY